MRRARPVLSSGWFAVVSVSGPVYARERAGQQQQRRESIQHMPPAKGKKKAIPEEAESARLAKRVARQVHAPTKRSCRCQVGLP
jgi:hypothetical protein